jgi:hypothetical protein
VLGKEAKVMAGFSGRVAVGERGSWTVPVLSAVLESEKWWFRSIEKWEVVGLVGSVSSVLIMSLYELENASEST